GWTQACWHTPRPRFSRVSRAAGIAAAAGRNFDLLADHPPDGYGDLFRVGLGDANRVLHRLFFRLALVAADAERPRPLFWLADRVLHFLRPRLRYVLANLVLGGARLRTAFGNSAHPRTFLCAVAAQVDRPCPLFVAVLA